MKEYPGKDTLIRFLRNVSLFRKADNAILSHLAEKTILSSFPASTTVIQKGDAGNTMFIIFSGRLKVHDGEHTVANLERGQFFGELSLLDSEPRSMSVTTLEPSVLGSISRDDFYEGLNHYPAITRDLIAVLNERLRNHNTVLISEFKSREAQLQELVKLRTAELDQKNKELEVALEDLKKSQLQLIQSEKLASLGQLTAGIAHEIQNPLNFVINFSEISQFLVKEVKEVTEEEERGDILNDLEMNLEKIHHHGKRADSIVKNMLEHSRSGSGEKQRMNINNLCKEYFNLSFHGTIVNNKDFNCKMTLHIDETIPQLNIIAQDISRVLINLFNNAFYVVKEKGLRKSVYNTPDDYVPEVTLTTVNKGNWAEIRIRDNGTGISERFMEKIFQPFFTTKPSGQGTGLGLSLSYDVIKSHGGEIKVETRANEFTEFIITLPI